ncbi:hypothetical protein I7I48_12147 [Histoplasma ohiense]|nr:hypothetical protein I7I48_12147 [Histoplasma ohiense (nom. inval.)]
MPGRGDAYGMDSILNPLLNPLICNTSPHFISLYFCWNNVDSTGDQENLPALLLALQTKC